MAGGIPSVRRPCGRQARLDLKNGENLWAVWGLSGMKMPIFKRSAVPDNPPRGTHAPEPNSHKTQHHSPFSDLLFCTLIRTKTLTGSTKRL